MNSSFFKLGSLLLVIAITMPHPTYAGKRTFHYVPPNNRRHTAVVNGGFVDFNRPVQGVGGFTTLTGTEGQTRAQNTLAAPQSPSTKQIKKLYRYPVHPPTPQQALEREKAAIHSVVEASLTQPRVVRFTREQFEQHALNLVLDLYAETSNTKSILLTYTFSASGDTINKAVQIHQASTLPPTSSKILALFEAGQPFYAIRPTSLPVACGMCNGTGLMRTALIKDANGNVVDTRGAECTRCKATGKTHIQADLLYQIVLNNGP